MNIKNYKQNIYKNMKLLSDVRVIGLLAFLAVILLVAFSSVKVLQANFELQKKENELAKINQIRQLQNENLRLKNVYLESDEYLELTARRQFSKAKPGEKLYIIPKSVALSKAKKVDLTPKEKKRTLKEERRPGYIKNLNDWRDFFLHKD